MTLNNVNIILVLLILAISSCQNDTEETLNQALQYEPYPENKESSSDDLKDGSRYLSDNEIQSEISLVTFYYQHETLSHLDPEKWAGYFSGFYIDNKVDFPCVLYNPKSDSLLVSSKRLQKWYKSDRIEEALETYKEQLSLSGYFSGDDSNDDNRNTSEIEVSTDQRYMLERISPVTAFVYFSGVGANEFDFPLIYACDQSYDARLILLGKQGLNREYYVDEIDSVFNFYTDFIEGIKGN